MKNTYYMIEEHNNTDTTSPVVDFAKKRYILTIRMEDLDTVVDLYKRNSVISKLNNRILIALESDNEVTPVKIIKNIKSHLEYKRIENKRIQEKPKAILELKVALKEEGIQTGLELLLQTGTRKRRKQIGNINTILGKTLKSDVGDADVILLLKELGRDYKKDTKKYMQHNKIKNIIDIIDLGPTAFSEKFGRPIVSKIIHQSGAITIAKLVEFGQAIGRSLVDDIKKKLLVDDAIDFWRLDKKGGFLENKKYFGILLNKTLNDITFEDRVNICKTLNLCPGKDIADYIRYSNKPTMYKSIIGLGFRKNTFQIIYHYLDDINAELGYNIIERMVGDLYNRLQKLYTFNSIQEYLKVAKTRDMRNIQEMGLILGYNIREINYGHKAELGKKFTALNLLS